MTERENAELTNAAVQPTWTVSCDISLSVVKAAELAFQFAVATTAHAFNPETFDARVDSTPVDIKTVGGPHGSRLQLLHAQTGLLTVHYNASGPIEAPSNVRDANDELTEEEEYDRLLYARPSRYCPTDRLVGFARTEFGVVGDNASDHVRSITDWINERIIYQPGSGSVHDSAEDTLLNGAGSCRDFAHLGIALCRASGISARFVSVYAPGLSPMDFHAVFETLQGNRWLLHDATRLAPRSSMVRIVTGRDAADSAFASVEEGAATLESVEVSATTNADLQFDDHYVEVELP